jgi:hypothetical protein
MRAGALFIQTWRKGAARFRVWAGGKPKRERVSGRDGGGGKASPVAKTVKRQARETGWRKRAPARISPLYSITGKQ